MRPIIPLACALLVSAVMTVRADGVSAIEADMNRPGGAYLSLPASSADACVALCAQDQICMAWSFKAADNACELKAVITPATPAEGFQSGLSARAPYFARHTGADADAPIISPAQTVAAIENAPTAPASLTPTASAAPLALGSDEQAQASADLELLGGRSADTGADLRRRFRP